MSDEINHPKHYNSHPTGIEAVQVCALLSFEPGSALKYLWRGGLKTDVGRAPDGRALRKALAEEARLRDLRKAEWYLLDTLRGGKDDRAAARIVEADSGPLGRAVNLLFWGPDDENEKILGVLEIVRDEIRKIEG